MLRTDDPFSDMNDVRRFINWYEQHDHRTAWDDARYARAKELIEQEAQHGQAPT